MVSKCQLSVPLPEGKHAMKRQLHSRPFTLREAASEVKPRPLKTIYSGTLLIPMVRERKTAGVGMAVMCRLAMGPVAQ